MLNTLLAKIRPFRRTPGAGGIIATASAVSVVLGVVCFVAVQLYKRRRSLL